MKRKTQDKRKLHKDCWDLDFAFIKWLNVHLKVYKKDAARVVDLDYHKFDYNGRKWSQGEIIDRLISLTNSCLLAGDIWSDGYEEKVTEILNLWVLVFPAMWW